jgi:hypothetical protein
MLGIGLVAETTDGTAWIGIGIERGDFGVQLMPV